MTNETNYKPCKLDCNGATKDFPFEFQVHKNDELFVNLINTETQEITLLVEGPDYSVKLEATGGNVTTTTAYADIYEIMITRKTSSLQRKSFSTSGGFQSSELENAFDRVSCNLQDMQYNIDTFKTDFSSSVRNEVEAYKLDTDKQIADLTNSVNTQITTNKADTDAQLAANKQELLGIQSNFETETNTAIQEFKDDVNTKITTVANAADKINTLEESITLCQNSAEIAVEQATIATQKAEEILDTKEILLEQLNSKQDKLIAGEGILLEDNVISSDLDKLNQSKALETGEVSSDSDVLADIRKYARSTFDKSKFTVVGSPTITEDGIASGLNSSNRIQSPTLNTSANFSITEKITAKDILKNNVQVFLYCFCKTDNTKRLFDLRWDAGKLLCVYTNSQGAVVQRLIDFSPQENTEYVFNLIVQNGVLTIKINDVLRHTITNLYVDGISYLILGSTGTSFNGSIDLKHFSITANGVEVFSGNKTGVDTIKPDDYTIVGSPTISNDGIASGFSDNNYVKSTYSMPQGVGQFDIYGAFTTNSTIVQNQSPLSFGDTGNNGILLQTTSTNLKVYTTTDGSSWGTEWATVKLETNTKYYYRISQDSTSCKFYMGTFQDNMKLVGTTTTRLASFSAGDSNYAYLGVRGSILTQYFNGSIDLNSFKIYVDGNLVYQPCLKIPYTLSKTGSKIVQSIYRDRVKDMYEQQGYAPYYTLGENDFTLPMGEIYGMIERKDSRSGHYLLELVPSIFPIDDAGVHLTDGSLISQDGIYAQGVKKIKDIVAKYPQFSKTETEWQALKTQYGEVPCVVIDDNAKTLRLPLIVNPIKGVNDFSQLAQVIEAGLPNITGTVSTDRARFSSANGAFAILNTSAQETGTVGTGNASFTLDASRCSAVYGKSDTVQPQQPTGCYYIVLATSTKTNIQVDINKYVSDLNLKQDKCIHIIETYVNGTSWYRVWSDGWCEQGSSLFNNSTTLTYSTTFLKPFNSNDYSITTSFTSTSTGSSTVHVGALASRSATDFKMYIPSSASALSWVASGYIR